MTNFLQHLASLAGAGGFVGMIGNQQAMALLASLAECMAKREVFSPEETITRARSRIGEHEYSLGFIVPSDELDALADGLAESQGRAGARIVVSHYGIESCHDGNVLHHLENWQEFRSVLSRHPDLLLLHGQWDRCSPESTCLG